MKVTPFTRDLLKAYREDREAARKMLDAVHEENGTSVMNAGPWMRRGNRPRPYDQRFIKKVNQ